MRKRLHIIVRNTNENFLIEVVILFVSILAIIILWRDNFTLLLILTLIYVIRSYFWHKPDNHLIFIAGGVILATMEIIFATIGIYQFSFPSIFGIPFWLPVAWGIGSVFVFRSFKLITHK